MRAWHLGLLLWVVSCGTEYETLSIQTDQPGKDGGILGELPTDPWDRSDGPSLGMNVSAINYWTSAWTLLDVFKRSDAWIEQDDQTWDTGNPLDLDEDGWVRSLRPGKHAASIVNLGAEGHYPSGLYVVRYDGDGLLEYEWDAVLVDRGPGRDVLEVANPTNQGFLVKLVDTNPDDYLRNIRVIVPGGICDGDPTIHHETDATCPGVYQPYEDVDQDLIFHPLYVADLLPFGSLRFASLLATSYTPAGRWNDRVKISDAHWGSQALGSPPEIAIKLANVSNSDAWVDMPYAADEDYVRAFAEMALADLDPARRLTLEYSNEVWNSAWPYEEGNGWIEAAAVARWPDSAVSDYEKRQNWYGMRSAQMCATWRQVWGDQAGRITCVIAGQSAWDYPGRVALECPLYVEEGNEPCAQQVDAFAIAPYFGFLGDDAYADQVRAWTSEPDGGLDAFFASLGEDPLASVIADMAANRSLATEFGLPLLAYEGGQHFLWQDHLADDPQIADFFWRANGDPRMGLLYTIYLEGWRDHGGDILVHHTDVAAPSRYGSWGAQQHQLDDDAPKYNALLDFIAQNPAWW